MSVQPIVRQSGRGSALRVFGERIEVLASAEETGGVEAFLQSGPEGSGPPPHAHPWDESYFVLEGELEVLLGDRPVVVAAGGFVHVPRGVVHTYRTRSAEARFLSVNSHGQASAMFAAFDRAIPNPPFDLQVALEIATQHGLTVPPPPPGAR